MLLHFALVGNKKYKKPDVFILKKKWVKQEGPRQIGKKKNRNFTSCTTNNVEQTTVLIMSNQSMNVSKFTIILYVPIVYMNVLTTGGFCTDSLKAKITPQINHLICKVRKISVLYKQYTVLNNSL